MPDSNPSLERYVKIGSIMIAVATFVFGVVQFSANQKARLAQAETEARKPYLERQLQLYADASRAAATLATASDPKTLAEARQRFFQLYWGELAMVEDLAVDKAMHEFAIALERELPPHVLQICSIRLSHLLRKSLEHSFGSEVWRSPYKVEPSCLAGTRAP